MTRIVAVSTNAWPLPRCLTLASAADVRETIKRTEQIHTTRDGSAIGRLDQRQQLAARPLLHVSVTTACALADALGLLTWTSALVPSRLTVPKEMSGESEAIGKNRTDARQPQRQTALQSSEGLPLLRKIQDLTPVAHVFPLFLRSAGRSLAPDWRSRWGTAGVSGGHWGALS
jgi:hypothetical protein